MYYSLLVDNTGRLKNFNMVIIKVIFNSFFKCQFYCYLDLELSIIMLICFAGVTLFCELYRALLCCTRCD